MEFNAWLSKESTVYGWRDVCLKDKDGKVLFEMSVEAPVKWSDKAVRIFSSKYFRRVNGRQENSVRQVFYRVTETIVKWGLQQKYFDAENAEIFGNELMAIMEGQYCFFNSPSYFNLGIDDKASISACYILAVEDNMESILDWYKQEGLIFRDGSGAGINISTLRSFREYLSGGGRPSGPISFMGAADASAGIIRSGGTLRRAAKLVAMDVSHPDIIEFIQCKIGEEKKAKALVDAGYDSSIGGEAYSTVKFQNSNHSVRVSDEFMKLKDDDDWELKNVVDGETQRKEKVGDIWDWICDAIMRVSDPGIQFDDVINEDNTVSNFDKLTCSNPCSEYMGVNWSACNLASLNLLKFSDKRGQLLNDDLMAHVIRVMVTAQDIVIDKAHYPVEKIKENSSKLRPIGLGYANLGALMMIRGLPYGSEGAKNLTEQITSMMTVFAYSASIEIAKELGPFSEFDNNKEHVREWVRKRCQKGHYWDDKYAEIFDKIFNYGVRNSQLTLLAPTGTIGICMDSSSFGIEPITALKETKWYADGSVYTAVNSSVEPALKNLGYNEKEIAQAIIYIETEGDLSSFFFHEPGHAEIFKCAYKAKNTEPISPKAHIDVMASAQKHLHGAISKTVALPENVTKEEIKGYIRYAWEQKVKAIAFYRDGSKAAQPVQAKVQKEHREVVGKEVDLCQPVRVKPPVDREGKTYKLEIGNFEAYLTVNYYGDNFPCEIFIEAGKTGTTIAGLLRTIAILTSLAIQYGVPLKALVEKFKGTCFEPVGFTGRPEIPMVSSVVDYIFKILEQYVEDEEGEPEEFIQETIEKKKEKMEISHEICVFCGGIMIRAGKCHTCPKCGETNGCS